MKATSLIAAAMLGLPLASIAQPNTQDDTRRIPAAKGTSGDTRDRATTGAQYGQGGSPHCDAMSGVAREQCLKDEGAKTDSKGPSETPAAGRTAPSPYSEPRPPR